MTILTNRNNDTNSQINSLSDQLAQMQQMIADMQNQMRQLNQQHKAQETLTKEWESTSKTVAKAFKDACSVYGNPEAIDDMISDLQSIAEEVKQDFDTYAESDRYLNQVTAEIEDEEPEVITPVAVLEAVMPDENDDITPLNTLQIKQLIKEHNLELNDIKKLAIMLNFEVPRSIKSFTEQGANILTRAELEGQIQLIKPKTLSLDLSTSLG